MAIILKSLKYHEIKVDSYMIIGVMGYEYQKFLKSLSGELFYRFDEIDNYDKTVLEYLNEQYNILDSEKIDAYLNDLKLNKSYLKKRISELSHSERKLFQYLQMLLSKSSIIVVQEPFIDLDYNTKKRIVLLFKRLSKYKTIIIGSFDSDMIYSLCKKVLLLGKDKYMYDYVSILANKNVLKKYHLTMPQIIEFVRLAKDKKVHLPYSKDIRDLIKDVFKHVSK